TDGIFQSAAEVQAHGSQPDAKPGDVRYVDLNGDGRITDADRYNAGSAVPDVAGGLFFDGRYRRFDFALNLRGSAGGKIFNLARGVDDGAIYPNPRTITFGLDLRL